ncbi:MAG: VWA domain-containing protein, partial [Acetatifactor sp.]|nr:VWA domain-containing protein [Acetatifactor sp.]
MNRERRRVKHSVCSLLITALAVVSAFFYVMYASATGTNSFLQGYYVQEGSLTVQCASLADIGNAGETRQFTVTISGEECPVRGISTVEEEGEGVTFYCLVDVSGSMRQEQMEAAKEVLSAICEGLREQDNMVIGALGTTLEVSGFLTDGE